MSPTVVAAVLAAAVLHATWNAILKAGLDPFRLMVLTAMCGAAVALPFLLWLGLPPLAAVPAVFASHLLHVGYMLALTEAYRTGDFGRVYPIARGTAPLITAAVAAFIFPDRLGWTGFGGILLLGSGICLMSLRKHAHLERLSRRSIGFALTTSAFIAAYSVVDGYGGRLSGNTVPYSLTLFVLDGISMAALAWWRRGAASFKTMRPYIGHGLVAGSLSNVGYGTVIWAMSVAPVAAVAALRETSVLFAVLIAAVWLREPLPPVRLIAAALILSGVVLLRLS